jgi:hypothetical protein
MFLPKVNVRKKSAWDADPEKESEDISTGDTKVHFCNNAPWFSSLRRQEKPRLDR